MIKFIEEKLKNEKSIDKILIFLVCAILLITNILVGSPTNNNASMINIIVTLVAMIFIIIKKISQKERIIKNKLDICVLFLCVSSCIPSIFNTYATLTGSINYILKYILVFLIYIMLKDLTKGNPKLKNYIINIIIISGVIFVILGIDKMSTNIFFPFTKSINMPEFTYEEIRMDSLFSYANAFAAFCSMALFLAIGNYIKEENKIKKYVIEIAIFLLETGIILSYSRTILIFLLLTYLIYLFLLKDKESRIKAIESTIIIGIFVLAYSTIYMKLLSAGYYNILWLLLLIFSLVAPVVVLIFERLNTKLLKIKIKYVIFFILTIIIIFIITIIIGLQQTEPLVLFNTSRSEKEVTKELYQIKGNTNYTFTFDIEAKSGYENTDLFKITILEKNKYFDDIVQTEMEFGTYTGKKEITITTTENTTEVFIIFSSKIVKDDMYLKINSLQINNKEEVLNYKFLPTSLINKIENINFNTKSAWERGVFIKDALKLAKDNFLFGIGGDGWQYREGEVQSYYYWAREVHSYPVQVFLEFGILGLLSLIGIIIIVAKYSYSYLKNQKDIEFVTILCSVLIVFLHSFLDFDMSYMCIMISIFTLLGILNTIIIPRDDSRKKTKNIVNILIFIGLIPIFIINGLNLVVYSKIAVVENENNIDIAYENLQKLNKYPTYLLTAKEQNVIIMQMYSKAHEVDFNTEIIDNLEFILKHEKYNDALENCRKLIEIYTEKDNIPEENIVKINEVCNIAKETKISELYNASENLKRQLTFINIAEILSNQYEKVHNEKIAELSKEMYKIVIDEYDSVLKRISDYEKCRISKEDSEQIIEKLNENYQKAKNMVE